jgi:hypothetical protein
MTARTRKRETAPDGYASLLYLMASSARTINTEAAVFVGDPELREAITRLQEVLPELARLVEQAERPS